MSDRKRLNDFLACRNGGEHETRGDLVLLKPTASETIEVCRSECAAVLGITLGGIECFYEHGLSLKHFCKNPVCLFDHDYEGLPVARSLWERLWHKADGGTTLIAKVQFHLDTEVSREAWALVLRGALTAWAMGVLPDEWEWVERSCLPAECTVTEYDLCELSVVPSVEDAERLDAQLRERRITAPALVKALAARGIRG